MCGMGGDAISHSTKNSAGHKKKTEVFLCGGRKDGESHRSTKQSQKGVCNFTKKAFLSGGGGARSLIQEQCSGVVPFGYGSLKGVVGSSSE